MEKISVEIKNRVIIYETFQIMWTFPPHSDEFSSRTQNKHTKMCQYILLLLMMMLFVVCQSMYVMYQSISENKLKKKLSQTLEHS